MSSQLGAAGAATHMQLSPVASPSAPSGTEDLTKSPPKWAGNTNMSRSDISRPVQVPSNYLKKRLRGHQAMLDWNFSAPGKKPRPGNRKNHLPGSTSKPNWNWAIYTALAVIPGGEATNAVLYELCTQYWPKLIKTANPNAKTKGNRDQSARAATANGNGKWCYRDQDVNGVRKDKWRLMNMEGEEPFEKKKGGAKKKPKSEGVEPTEDIEQPEQAPEGGDERKRKLVAVDAASPSVECSAIESEEHEEHNEVEERETKQPRIAEDEKTLTLTVAVDAASPETPRKNAWTSVNSNGRMPLPDRRLPSSLNDPFYQHLHGLSSSQFVKFKAWFEVTNPDPYGISWRYNNDLEIAVRTGQSVAGEAPDPKKPTNASDAAGLVIRARRALREAYLDGALDAMMKKVEGAR